MGKGYGHIKAEERAAMMLMQREGKGVRTIARELKRAASSISRELSRNAGAGVPYDAAQAGERARAQRFKCKRTPKLACGTALFGTVEEHLRKGWSPEQIAGTLKRMHPGDKERTVSHETIYNAIYIMPRGELRKELISCLRQAKGKRRPRSRGADRRGQIPDMASIDIRPVEAEDRLIPGHWEGDLIKGASNRSSVGTLMERSSRLVMLARLDDATAPAVIEGFSRIFNSVSEPMKKTMTYDRGKEMSQHKILTDRTGVAVFFADPHSPWQRGSNENTNGLLRQYLPKGADLSIYSQDDLDAIAGKLNTRPRKIHGFRSPLEVYQEMLDKEVIRLNNLSAGVAIDS
ncbi:MAG: IS30 family transposase [Nitrospirales bacterium]|nr:IS30 family transposase [Nitrospirales bacterium]